MGHRLLASWWRRVAAGVCAATFVVTAVGWAQSSVTLEAVGDSYVDSGQPDANFGWSGLLWVGLNDQTMAVRLTLARFDLANIPAGATVHSATLRLSLIGSSGMAYVDLGLFRCRSDWQEMAVAWSTMPQLEAVGQSQVGTQPGWVEWDATGLVAAWVSQGLPNYGLAIAGPGSGNPYVRTFASREQGPAPQLVVTYSVPTATFTPTRTHTATATWTPTPTPTSTRTHTATATWTPTPTRTHTATPTWTPTPTPTISVTPTSTPTRTPTPLTSVTPTLTPTRTPTASPTPTPSRTPTAIPSATATPPPTATPGACPDPYEPNDDFGSAWPVGPPVELSSYICTPSDDDHFSFGAVISDTIRLRLEGLPADYDLELYDPTGALIGASYSPGTAVEQLQVMVSNFGGDYRARVFGVAGQHDPYHPYKLRIEVIPYSEPTLVVNTTDDADDGACNGAHCSLREAFDAVNGGAARRIEFAIPAGDAGFDGTVWTIRPAAPLPVLGETVEIDGASQTASGGDTNPDGPELMLDGSAAGADARGIDLLEVASPSVTALVISGWDGAGIHAERCTQLRVRGCSIGTDPAGTTAQPNGEGVYLQGGHSHTIGGSGTADGNLISGNSGRGVLLSGTAYVSVVSNLIGTDRDGTSPVPNGYGLRLEAGAEHNRIGGADAGERNVISGNRYSGVELDGASTQYNRLFGNLIGTTVSGEAPLANGGSGVRITSSVRNDVGGTAAGQGNLIGGNSGAGVYVSGGDLNTIAGNRIGTRSGSGVSLGNDGVGVLLWGGSQNNVVGPGNIISDNADEGVLVYESTTTRNTITQNSITRHPGEGISLGGGINIGNENLPAPAITAVEPARIEGAACPRCTVEIFSDADDEAEVYEGTVTALATGAWSWVGTGHRANVHATATDSSGNTSELSRCFDAFEPNDSLAAAATIDSGVPVEARICSSSDVDYYMIEAEAGTVLTADLASPQHYALRLYGSDGLIIVEAPSSPGSLSSRLLQTIGISGEYFVEVDGPGGVCNPDDPYTLNVVVASLNTDARIFIDEGAMLSPLVYKLIPDYAAPIGVTLVDVVVEVTADGSEELAARVTLEIPGDVLGVPVSAEVRESSAGVGTPVPVTALGGGRYRAELPLSGLPPPVRGQLSMRFEVNDWNVPGDVVPECQVEIAPSSEVVATAVGPPIRLVSRIPVVIVSNRTRLYDPSSYDPEDAAWLLAILTWAAQGPSEGVSGAPAAVIYYVDDYTDRIRDWDNMTWDPSNEALANQAARSLDVLLDDWIEDSGIVEHVLIVGDDDVVPMYRRPCPCEGTESAHPDSDPVIVRVVSNDYILTDNLYADTDGSDWDRGELELSVGRIVGDSADDLRRLLEAGLSGPVAGDSPRAVLASWDGCDLDFDGGSGVLDHVRDWGFSASSAMVDNSSWRKPDLIDALGDPFTLFLHADHGNPNVIGTPEGDDIDQDELATAIDNEAAARLRPFVGLQDCRDGFALGFETVVDRLVQEGASGIAANTGISWFCALEGTEWYTEELFNMFMRRAMPGDGTIRSIGAALRKAKRDYSPGHLWYCRDRTAVQELTLYGLPWITIPRSVAAKQSDAVEEPLPAFGFGTPVPVGGGAWQVTASLDLASYRVDSDSVPGFDVVEVEGCGQRLVDGVMLPSARLVLRLPPGAEVGSVLGEPSQPLQLGMLRIPSHEPGVPLYPDGADEQWYQTPPGMGTVPSEPLTWELRDIEGFQEIHVNFIPVAFEAPTGMSTLTRHADVAVTYTAPQTVALTGLSLSPPVPAPAGPLATTVEIINVADEPADVLTRTRVLDQDGNLVSESTGEVQTVEAGGAVVIQGGLSAPSQEGGYRIEFEVEHDGEVVGTAGALVEVAAGRILGLRAPRLIVPGRDAVIAVEWENLTGGPQEVEVSFALHDASGRPEHELDEVTVTVGAGESAEVELAFSGREVPVGRYQLVATVGPNSGRPRSAARWITVDMGPDPIRRPAGRRP